MYTTIGKVARVDLFTLVLDTLGASVGLDFAWDTYQGFGVGGSVGYGFKIGDGPFGVGATIGVAPMAIPMLH
jgi:hypothetical protein